MRLFTILSVCLLFVITSCSKTSPSHVAESNIYQFKVVGIRGGIINFSNYRGKKILIVNTASECRYTDQYQGLERLSKTYRDELVVVGFPSNDFGSQEPGTNAEIIEFCQQNYGVTFPMAAKVSVAGKAGLQPQIYQWLTQKEKNGVMSVEIKWNFTKFLINEEGRLVASFESAVKPLSSKITNAIEK